MPFEFTPVEKRIYLIRGRAVILDFDIAHLYAVETRRLNEQVRRNPSRFPADFAFRLTRNELKIWMSQYATSNPRFKMGLRKPPTAFTEQGVAMLSSVLESARAVSVNIAIMREFQPPDESKPAIGFRKED